MNDLFTKVTTWIKANMLIAVLIAVGIIIMFFGKQVKKLFFGTRRVKHRAGYYAVRARSGRSLPRSVGVRRNRPAVRRKQYTKDGKAKKPWQIKGSEAARRHMRRIRQMR
jgi:hypothetical protein